MNKDDLIIFLQQTIKAQEEQNKQLLQKLDEMQHRINQLLRTLYGAKNEKDKKPNDDNDDDLPPNAASTNKKTNKKSNQSVIPYQQI